MNQGIIIIWPKHYNFKNSMIDEIKLNDYILKDSKELNVSQTYIKNILLEIHCGKKWWDNNINTEYIKRLDETKDEQKITYFIIEKENIHLYLKGFKKLIRDKYKLDKSYFHISDPDCFKHLGKNCNCECNDIEFNNEFKKHFDILTNKNTIHFLNNAIYEKNYNFYKFFDKYKKIMVDKNLSNTNFCIDNGGILAAYGIRDTHDLDFLTLYGDNINMNDKDIGCENKNHRLEYEKLGYNIKDIIDNSENNFNHFGIKFMSLDILKKFKYNRTHTIGTGHKKIRQKDINDYKLIKNL